MFATFTVADTPVEATRASVQGIMRAAGNLFRRLRHYGAHLAAQISPGTRAGYVHPHAHALFWQYPEHPADTDWLSAWRPAVDETNARLVAQYADVQESRDMQAVAMYISRGPVDMEKWSGITDDLREIVSQLKGLRLFATVPES